MKRTRAPRDPEPAEMPAEPMLCTLVDAPFDSPDWIFEPKLDGVRVICEISKRGTWLWSRNGRPQNRQFPEIADALAGAAPADSLFDGELVCLDKEGRPTYRALQQRLHIEDSEVVVARAWEWPAELH